MYRPVIAITSGEPAGIGPELMGAIRAEDFPARLVIIGDQEFLQQRCATTGRRLHVITHHPGVEPQQPCVEGIQVALRRPALAGQLDAANAAYVLETLDIACQGCLDGRFDAMVTAPVQKDIINAGGIAFTGHTEYLAAMCGVDKPIMMLASDSLRVALATTHLPLRDVADAIDGQELEYIISVLHSDLQSRFGLREPHIKVCGLNPHAGENGYLGREEIDIISPAIEAMRARGINVSGPYPADTVFTPASLQDADVILAMYHDQGLPVLKHTGFSNAINTTLGMPIIRSSVDHGTALSLAGSGRADPGSLFAAIHSAIEQVAAKRTQGEA
jgi:4-hydroxythreonine-4-phosphate dehydrogenase